MKKDRSKSMPFRVLGELDAIECFQQPCSRTFLDEITPKEKTLLRIWSLIQFFNNNGDAVRAYDSHGYLVDYFGWGEYQ